MVHWLQKDATTLSIGKKYAQKKVKGKKLKKLDTVHDLAIKTEMQDQAFQHLAQNQSELI